MTFETRLALLTFNGVQAFPGMDPLYLFTDALTGSTFSVKPGQPIGQGLAAFIIHWQALSGECERARPSLLGTPCEHGLERRA